MANDEEDDVMRDVIGAEGIRRHELVQYALGEMDDTSKRALEGRLAADPAAQERLQSIEIGHAAAADHLNVAVDSAKILERLDAPEPSRLAKWWPAIGLVAALAAVPVVVLTQDPTTGSSTRTKGLAPTLELYVNELGGPRRADDGVHLGEGDAIQFKYRADGHRFLFVLSVDEAGRISPLYPDAPTESIAVNPAGLNVLDGSIILDDVVGPERIFAVFSKAPIPYGELEAAIETTRRSGTDVTSLPEIGLRRDDVVETSVLIIKE